MRTASILSVFAVAAAASVASAAKIGDPMPAKTFVGNSVSTPREGALSYLDIDLAGWQAGGGFTNIDNTFDIYTLGSGTQIVSAEMIGVEFEALGASWGQELTLSLNDLDGDVLGDFWDSRVTPATGAPYDDPGSFGPFTRNFDNPGLFSSAPFTLVGDDLYVEAYDTFNDAGIDAEISAGTLRVGFIAVPEPTTVAGLVAAGLVALRRSRR
jgi:hypothetical protein